MTFRYETRRTPDGYRLLLADEHVSPQGLISNQRLIALISIAMPHRDNEPKHTSAGGVLLPTGAERLMVEYGINAQELDASDVQHLPTVSEFTAENSSLEQLLPDLMQASAKLLKQLTIVEISIVEGKKISNIEQDHLETLRRHLVDETAAPTDDLPGFYL